MTAKQYLAFGVRWGVKDWDGRWRSIARPAEGFVYASASGDSAGRRILHAFNDSNPDRLE